VPIYEYRCPTCGTEFEQLVAFSRSDEVSCPTCTRLVLSARCRGCQYVQAAVQASTAAAVRAATPAVLVVAEASTSEPCAQSPMIFDI